MGNNPLRLRLRELRLVYNYSQDYVAEVIGKTRQTYSHYETGRRKPPTETLYMLASLYNVSVDDLLHLSIEFDKNVFYETLGPSQSSDDLSAYLEKELLYYFQKLAEPDKKELIEITKIKAKKKSQ